jgi:CheY-like chemotaxis protein
MVPVIVILTFVIFVMVDLLLRFAIRRYEQRKEMRRRRQALDIGLHLEFAEEAASLKRVEVDAPRARILAVDDESIVLDSFRKILVLAGYSVDTVETGQEALTLIRGHEYDFVFADLKMPGMDGLEVTKAVKHLRPDIDVVIITGYATVESAVAAMKYGAMDYVEKPFTEDELVEFSDNLLIRRQDRREREAAPEIRLVGAAAGEQESPHDINVPGGVFVAPEHTWVRIEMNGQARVGLDDLVHKTVGPIDDVDLPRKGDRIGRGELLFRVRQGERRLCFSSPLSGRVANVNLELPDHLDLMRRRPYENGWVCGLEPSRLGDELQDLRIGADAVEWYQAEVKSFRQTLKGLMERRAEAEEGEREAQPPTLADSTPDELWQAFASSFLTSDGPAGEARR